MEPMNNRDYIKGFLVGCAIGLLLATISLVGVLKWIYSH